jgi:ABC-type transporter Mla subunit MlaD
MHVMVRISDPVGGARREASTRAVRVWAALGIVVLALVVGGLGAAASASPAHSTTGQVQVSAYQPALAWMY